MKWNKNIILLILQLIKNDQYFLHYIHLYPNSLNFLVMSIHHILEVMEIMMRSLSKAYKLKEVASTSNPMNFLLNSSAVDSDNSSSISDKEEEEDNDSEEKENERINDDYDYDETDTESYYCNTLAKKSLSAASSIKSLSSSIIDNISSLKPSKVKDFASRNFSSSTFSSINNNYSEHSYENHLNTNNNNDNNN
eukprot:jgi/Orpsp1_1/1188666/evm.model.d7180000066391.1